MNDTAMTDAQPQPLVIVLSTHTGDVCRDGVRHGDRDGGRR
jgi:hypothetical protein